MNAETFALISYIKEKPYSQRKPMMKIIRKAADKTEAKIALRMALTRDWRFSTFWYGQTSFQFLGVDWGIVIDYFWKKWRNRNLYKTVYFGILSSVSYGHLYSVYLSIIMSDDVDLYNNYVRMYPSTRTLWYGTFETDDKRKVLERFEQLANATPKDDPLDYITFNATVGNMRYIENSLRLVYLSE
jgi:hypothetical protein